MTFILPIFCLLTFAGALTSWRRSPLYSNRTAIRLLSAFLLIAAVVVGVSVAIPFATSHLSQTMQAVVAVAAILLVTTGSSILLIRVTDSHVAQLPDSTRMVSIHRHRILRWVWRLLIFEVACTAAGWALPGSWGWLPIGIGGFLLILCGPTLAIFFMMARRNDRSFTAVMAAPWVHWVFSEAEWKAWAESQRDWEQSHAPRWTFKQAASLLLICAGLFAVGALIDGDGWLEKVTIVGGLTGFSTLLLGIFYAVDRSAVERHFRHLLASQAEVYLGDEGVYCNGSFTPWVLSGKYLVEATSTQVGLACMTLTFQSFNGGVSGLVVLRLPIPADQLAGPVSGLAAIESKLKTRCPGAIVHL